MKRLVLALPLLVGACASWPSGSYVAVQDSDAAVLAPAIAEYPAGALPAGTAVAVTPGGRRSDRPSSRGQPRSRWDRSVPETASGFSTSPTSSTAGVAADFDRRP